MGCCETAKFGREDGGSVGDACAVVMVVEVVNAVPRGDGGLCL
jgi:hypothetical protein